MTHKDIKVLYEVECTKWDFAAEHSLPLVKVLPAEENFYRYAQRASAMIEDGCWLEEEYCALCEND